MHKCISNELTDLAIQTLKSTLQIDLPPYDGEITTVNRTAMNDKPSMAMCVAAATSKYSLGILVVNRTVRQSLLYHNV